MLLTLKQSSLLLITKRMPTEIIDTTFYSLVNRPLVDCEKRFLI